MIDIEIRHDYWRCNRTCDLLMRYSTVESGKIHAQRCFPWNVLLGGFRGGNESRIIEVKSGREFVLEKGCYCLIPKNCEARYELKPDLHFVNLQFNIEIYPGIDLFENKPGIMAGSSPRRILNFLRILRMPYGMRPLLMLKTGLLEFALEMQPDFSIPQPDECMETLRHVLQNPSAAISVKTVSNHVDMTASAFSRKFRKLFGIPPKKYLDRILMERISAFFRTPLTLAEIAEKLQFSSAFQLSRFVHRMTGHSPSCLRKQY